MTSTIYYGCDACPAVRPALLGTERCIACGGPLQEVTPGPVAAKCLEVIDAYRAELLQKAIDDAYREEA